MTHKFAPIVLKDLESNRTFAFLVKHKIVQNVLNLQQTAQNVLLELSH